MLPRVLAVVEKALGFAVHAKTRCINLRFCSVRAGCSVVSGTDSFLITLLIPKFQIFRFHNFRISEFSEKGIKVFTKVSVGMG